ncbi:hypothetical protein [Enterococcus casseliflavus]|uniref:hypothetical protein n=1 Tax=Enterococcus casseliflavus TaxID=37734 RepID=UPI0018846068|nr:hypothetical protein [Enterococcus casseliflavus]MBE9909327.1 hypothetical protein [Enterococcus casseliflavus]
MTYDEQSGQASLQALRKVLNDESITYRSFMKNRYEQISERLKYEGLLDQPYDEMKNSIHRSELEEFYQYKEKTMRRYLKYSEEFSTSIFGKSKDLYTSVSTYT